MLELLSESMIAPVENITGGTMYDDIQTKLTRIQVGGCTCMTKTPVLQHHDEGCHYRLASEIAVLLIPPHQHFDDVAVDTFAAAMKEKMAAARAKGRTGWQNCSTEYLSKLLIEHIRKGDPRDVANFCMMLWHQSARIVQAVKPLRRKEEND